MRLPLLGFLVIVFSSICLGQSDHDKGIDLFREGKYSESIEILEKVSLSDEADYAAAMYLGASYLKTGNEKKATELFAKAWLTKSSGDPGLKYDKKLQLTYNPKPRFSNTAMGKESAGIIRLAVEFMGDGKLGFIFPFEASSDTLINEAIKTAKQIRFKPAKINDKPVSVVRVIEYAFWR